LRRPGLFDEKRWANNWRVVSPEGAVRVDLERSAARRQALGRKIRDLPVTTPVVLVATAPRARARARAFATEAAIEVEREYLALPSAASPAYLVEDAPAPIRIFLDRILVPPPRSVWSTPIDIGLRFLRVLPWRLVRMTAPGRVVVGRRT
jgi:hypothetical protein